MITFSNGHTFEFMAASGALGFDGKGWPWEKPLSALGLLDVTLFTSVTKTLTYQPRKGYFRWWKPHKTIKFLRDGVVNAMGLPNPGFVWWLQHIFPKTKMFSHSIVVSLDAVGESNSLEATKNFLCMIRLLNEEISETPCAIKGIELNFSCPSAAYSLLASSDILRRCEAARKLTQYPLVAKISPAQPWRKVGPSLKGMVDAITINSVPWNMIFPNIPSPLALYGEGGVSGKIIQSITWNIAEELKMLDSPPVVWPSIWNYKDLEKAFAKGAPAVSFGSVFLRYPWRPTLYVRRWTRKHNISTP